MSYFNQIKDLIENVPIELIDFAQPRDEARIPTQASSNFITNKEQGDWAEKLIINAINSYSQNYIAVKYGKSDDLVAGEEGFEKFFKNFNMKWTQLANVPTYSYSTKQTLIPN